MGQSYFIWKGQDSRNMHIVTAGAAPIIRGEERVSHITIPGRSGDLTEIEGDAVYNSYIQTVGLTVRGAANVRAAYNWLSGAGEITFSGEPDKKQRARVIGAVTLEKMSRNADDWQGEVQFYCDPIKRLRNEEQIIITESGYTLTNPGDLEALPLIQIEGAGTVTLTLGTNHLIIPECQSGYIVDSENQWILYNGVPVESAYTGSFLTIPVGESYLVTTGEITSLTITPGWRFR